MMAAKCTPASTANKERFAHCVAVDLTSKPVTLSSEGPPPAPWKRKVSRQSVIRRQRMSKRATAADHALGKSKAAGRCRQIPATRIQLATKMQALSIRRKAGEYLHMRLAPAYAVLLSRPRAIFALTRIMTWKADGLES